MLFKAMTSMSTSSDESLSC